MGKVNETRGKGWTMPVAYKGDLNAQAWIDSRQLAVVSNWMEENGEHPRYVSEIVRRCVEIVHNSLVQQGLAQQIESSTDAQLVMSARFGVRYSGRGRARKNAMHNIMMDEQRMLPSMFDRSKSEEDELLDDIKAARRIASGEDEIV